MKIHFLGAAQEVTGSMHLVECDAGRLLVDCGFYQGRRAESRERNLHLPDGALTADAVLLTHAHIDHSGSLPTLVREGFRGAIWCTPATRDLAAYMLRDSARIQQADAAWLNRKFGGDPDWVPVEPVYDERDAIAALARFLSVPYGHTFQPLPGVAARFLDAGHILGSAQVVLELPSPKRRVVFSGDLGRPGMPILRDPEPPPPADYAVMESTYGGRFHHPLAELDDRLAAVVTRAVSRRGKLIVPAFALERTQELVLALHRLHRAGRIPEVPVFVDSPLSVNLTEVFKMHPECYDEETRRFIEEAGDPFSFRTLRYVATVEESMALDAREDPIIIISASGMCESGRVLHHLRHAIGDQRNTILIVGFQAQHTLGRRIVERRPRVRVFGVEQDLDAEVVVLNGLSAHADQRDLLGWARHLAGARRLFLVHGEPAEQAPLAALLAAEGFAVTTPSRGEAVTLD